jgi:hypothetical protein
MTERGALILAGHRSGDIGGRPRPSRPRNSRTVAPKRRSGTAGDIDEALEVVNKGFGRHGARCTARMASFLEERASWGFTRLHHDVQPSDQGRPYRRHGQPIDL